MADLLYNAPIEHEPLRKNRFIFRFPSDLGISEWAISTGSRPKINQGSTEIQFLNTSTWVAGRYTWDSMQITFRDFVFPSTSQALIEWIRLCSESASGRQGYAAGYKRDVELDMLDPAGLVAQKWILKNAWISQCDFGSLGYSDDQLADITATLVIDYAILAY